MATLRGVAGRVVARCGRVAEHGFQRALGFVQEAVEGVLQAGRGHGGARSAGRGRPGAARRGKPGGCSRRPILAAGPPGRSEEHTSELQSPMGISSAGLCLKKKNPNAHSREMHKLTNAHVDRYPLNETITRKN